MTRTPAVIRRCWPRRPRCAPRCAALTAAKAAPFPGAANRISNFVGAEAAAERLRGLPQWRRAATVKANPDPPRTAASIAGVARLARRIRVDELAPVDLVVSGCVAVGADGARLGKGGGFADLEFALASAAGLITPETVVVTTVHELQVRPGGIVPTAPHDAPVDLIAPDRVIDCRAMRGPRPG